MTSLPGRADRPGRPGRLTDRYRMGLVASSLLPKKQGDAWTKWWKSFRENGGKKTLGMGAPKNNKPRSMPPLYHVAIYWVYHGISPFKGLFLGHSRLVFQ